MPGVSWKQKSGTEKTVSQGSSTYSSSDGTIMQAYKIDDAFADGAVTLQGTYTCKLRV